MSERHKYRMWWGSPAPGKVTSLPNGDIVCADALDCVSALRDRCADIVFLDPPFNLGKAYGKNGSQGDKKKEDDSDGFWNSPWPWVIGGAILVGGAATYLMSRPGDEVLVSAPTWK